MPLEVIYTGALPVYATIRRGIDGQVLTPGVGYSDWSDASLADYAVTMTSRGGDLYQADIPEGMEPGPYFVAYYAQAGAAPATTDTVISSGDRLYTGVDIYSPYARRFGVFYEGTSQVYAIIRRETDGNVYDVSRNTFALWDDDNLGSYCTNLTNGGGDFWYGIPESAVPAGDYVIGYYSTAGELDPPATTDALILQAFVSWSEALSDYALTSLASLKSHLRLSTSQYDGVLVDLINAATANIERLTGRKIVAREHYEWRDAPTAKRTTLKNFPIIALRRVSTGQTPALSLTHTTTTDLRATVCVQPDRVQLRRIDSTGTVVDSDFTFELYPTTASIATAGATGWTIAAPVSAPTRELELLSPKVVNGGSVDVNYPNVTIEAYVNDSDAGIVEFLCQSGGWSVYGRDAWRTLIQYRGGYEAPPSDLAQLCRSIATRMFREMSIDTMKKSESIGDYSYTLGSLTELNAGEQAIVARYAGASSYMAGVN